MVTADSVTPKPLRTGQGGSPLRCRSNPYSREIEPQTSEISKPAQRNRLFQRKNSAHFEGEEFFVQRYLLAMDRSVLCQRAVGGRANNTDRLGGVASAPCSVTNPRTWGHA